MYKESLFKLIRKEEVVIWAGAGLSINAGFPSGNELKEILLNDLTKPEQENINKSLQLPALAEEYFRLKNNNRNSLIRILNQTFLNKKPKSTGCHENLAIIPHFKTIITTNYDTLIEDALSQNGQVAYSAKQIPYLENGKTHIFKVHGDLKEPDSIIITDSDYQNFFKLDSENGVYWTVIKERLSTNCILFLGYNLDDPNISVIFDKITDELGANRKECFLVAPNLAKHKINNLSRKGIHYIDSTAEDLIKELIINLKENIIEDIEQGKTSADTFRNFLSNIDLLPDLKADRERYKVQSLRGTKETIEGKMNLTFKNDPEFNMAFSDFVTGKKVGNFEIPEERLIDADFRYGGVKFPNLKSISRIEFKSIPRHTTTIDIRFDDHFELTNIPTKIYGSHGNGEVQLKLHSSDLKANFSLIEYHKTDFNFTYKHSEICKNVKEEIELFLFLKKLSKGTPFCVYEKSVRKLKAALTRSDSMLSESEYFLTYFKSLQRIEKHFNIRFANISISSINKSTKNIVSNIIAAIDGQSVEYKYDQELTIELIENYPEETIKQLSAINEEKQPIAAFEPIEEILELHGHKINLGYKKTEFPEPMVINLKEIVDRKSNIVRIKSQSKKMIVSYKKEKW